jgi:hypothetical protein
MLPPRTGATGLGAAAAAGGVEDGVGMAENDEDINDGLGDARRWSSVGRAGIDHMDHPVRFNARIDSTSGRFDGQT